MLSFYFNIILLVLSTNKFAFGVFDGVLNSQCISMFTGTNGICMRANDCAEFKNYRNQLQICAFDGLSPIVCCPKNTANRNSQKRISAQSELQNQL